jgi:hypothetical protein
MNTSIKALAAAVALAASASANAALDNGDVNVLIVNGAPASGTTMLIDTNLAAADFVNGSITSWSSDLVAGLTADIQAFLSGASQVGFYAFGGFKSGFDTYFLSTSKTLAQPAVSPAQFNGDSFNSVVNTDANSPFANDDAGDGPDWEAGIGPTEVGRFNNIEIFGSTYVDNNPAGLPATFISNHVGFFAGNDAQALEDWNLDVASGQLTYGPQTVVPLPAGVWLLAAGLMGWLGFGRRNRAA